MHFRQKLIFMAFGATLALAGYLIATLVGDVTAQSEADKSVSTVVDKIVCRSLEIVNADGKTALTLNTYVLGGGKVSINDRKGKAVITMKADSAHGYIHIQQPDGGHGVAMSAGPAGGLVAVDYTAIKRAATIGVSDNGQGYISVNGKDHDGSIQLSNNEYGGSMAIFNKGQQNVLQASVSDRGNGVIDTRDKHGYKTGRLPR